MRRRYNRLMNKQEKTRAHPAERHDEPKAVRKKPGSLSGKVAVVAGATRGAGRGIARALGELGATVYCTGRSSGKARSDMNRPETIEETAAMVTAAGGQGIAIRVDHSVRAEVDDLARTVEAQYGRIDLLVNDIWGGDDLIDWSIPFYESDVDRGLSAMHRSIDTHLITSRAFTPMMVRQGHGRIIEITDGTDYSYRGNVYYSMIKTTIIHMAFALDAALMEKGIRALPVTPGFLRSEWMLDNFGVSEANWKDGVKKEPHFIASETPLFVGRAIAALAAEPDWSPYIGRAWASWTLSDVFDITDADGEWPHWGRYYEKTFGKQIGVATTDGAKPPATPP